MTGVVSGVVVVVVVVAVVVVVVVIVVVVGMRMDQWNERRPLPRLMLPIGSMRLEEFCGKL